MNDNSIIKDKESHVKVIQLKNPDEANVSSEKIEFETKGLVAQKDSKKLNIFNESSVTNETKNAQKENNIYLQVYVLKWLLNKNLLFKLYLKERPEIDMFKAIFEDEDDEEEEEEEIPVDDKDETDNESMPEKDSTGGRSSAIEILTIPSSISDINYLY